MVAQEGELRLPCCDLDWTSILHFRIHSSTDGKFWGTLPMTSLKEEVRQHGFLTICASETHKQLTMKYNFLGPRPGACDSIVFTNPCYSLGNSGTDKFLRTLSWVIFMPVCPIGEHTGMNTTTKWFSLQLKIIVINDRALLLTNGFFNWPFDYHSFLSLASYSVLSFFL